MNALSKPWIVPYLISCANTYGNVAWPPVGKPRTIQIIKFLTGPTPEDPEPTSYWAEISDYESHISGWITSDATSNFYKMRGCRLSSVQTGVFVIRSYRPLLTKAPPGPGYTSSWTSRLVLEIMDIELLGSEREPPFGSPKPATGHPGIQKWIAQRAIRLLQRRSPETEEKVTQTPVQISSASLREIRPSGAARHHISGSTASWSESPSEFFMDDIRPPPQIAAQLSGIWKSEARFDNRVISPSIHSSFDQSFKSIGHSPFFSAAVIETQPMSPVRTPARSSPEVFFSDWEPTPQPTEVRGIVNECDVGSPPNTYAEGHSTSLHSTPPKASKSSQITPHTLSERRIDFVEYTEESTPTNLKTRIGDVNGEGKEVDNDSDSGVEPRHNTFGQDPSSHAVGTSGYHVADFTPTGQAVDAIQLCDAVPPRAPFKAWTAHSVIDRHQSHRDSVRWKLKSKTSSSVCLQEEARFAGQSAANRISNQVPKHIQDAAAAQHTLPYQGRAGCSESLCEPDESDHQPLSSAMLHGTEKLTSSAQALNRESINMRRVTGVLPVLDIRRQAVGFEHLLLRKEPLPR